MIKRFYRCVQWKIGRSTLFFLHSSHFLNQFVSICEKQCHCCELRVKSNQHILIDVLMCKKKIHIYGIHTIAIVRAHWCWYMRCSRHALLFFTLFLMLCLFNVMRFFFRYGRVQYFFLHQNKKTVLFHCQS